MKISREVSRVCVVVAFPAAPRSASLSCACGPLRAWRARASACSVGRVCNFPNQSVSPAFSEIAEAAAELASTPLTWDSSVFVSQRPAAVALTAAALALRHRKFAPSRTETAIADTCPVVRV